MGGYLSRGRRQRGPAALPRFAEFTDFIGLPEVRDLEAVRAQAST
jgi:hypothetical protein